MKGFMVFVVLALAASANAGFGEKNIIDDAIAAKKCLEDAIATIQGSVNTLLGTVNRLQEVINDSSAKLKACQAIGGDNPTAIQQIQQATCIMNLVSQVQTDITNVVNDVQDAAGNLAGAGDLIGACIKPAESNKNMIDDALAIKECIERTIKTIEESIQTLMNTINNVQAIIDSNIARFEDCKALGAGGSIIDQIQEATCIMGMVDLIKQDINGLVTQIETSVQNLLNAGNMLNDCIPQ